MESVIPVLRRSVWMSILLSVVLLVCAPFAFAAPLPSSSVSVLANESGVVVTWASEPGAVGYVVWRNVGEDPTRARIVG